MPTVSPAPPISACLLEFWGLGDAVMMTPMLEALRAAGVAITVVCKPGTARLLRPTFPGVNYVCFDPPWTAFRGKYRLWRWPWRQLLALTMNLRRARFDWMVSVRRDPRDHLLMGLIGARMRLGFPSGLAKGMLTQICPEPAAPRPVAADWMELAGRIPALPPPKPPHLAREAYPSPPTSDQDRRPVIGLHMGARIAVRRWEPARFRELLGRLRECYDFRFVLVPDIDGFGEQLADLADSVHRNLTIEEMIGVIAACDLLVCNDSAPGHIADALDVPVVTIFGPTHPVRFRPYAARNLVVERDICPYRPCFDYCRFPEPKCLTELSVREIWPEVHAHLEALITTGVLPSRLRRPTEPS